MITKQELERLKELEKNATEGPWVYNEDHLNLSSEVFPIFTEHMANYNTSCSKFDDWKLIAESRNLLPKLIESFEVLRDALQWYADGWHYTKTENGDIELDNGEHARKALAQAIGGGHKMTPSDSEARSEFEEKLGVK